MSSASIGRGALILSTNSAGLSAGLARAEAEVRASAGRIRSSVATMGGGGKGGLFAGIGGALKGGLAGLGIGLGIGGLTAIWGSLGERIDRAGAKARAFGLETQSYTGLQHAAKMSNLSIEQLDTSLGFFRRQVEGPLDTALFNLADRIQGTADPGERARLAVEAFGRAGIGMLPMLEEGSAGVKKLQAEAVALGVAFDDVEASKLESANDAIDRIVSAAQGLAGRVLVAVAPIVEFWSGKITAFVTRLQPVFEWVTRALTTYWKIYGAVVDEVLGLVEWVVQGVWDWAKATLGLGGEWMKIEDVIVTAFKFIGVAGAYAWDTLKAGAGGVAIAIGHVVKAFSELVGAFRRIAELAKELPEAARPDWLNRFTAGVETFEAKTRGVGDTIIGWGKRQLEGFGSSARSVDAWFDKLFKKAEDAKKEATIAADVAEKAAAKYAPNTALVFGTKEELSARIKAEFGGQGDAKKQLDEQKKGNAKLDKVNEHLAKIAGRSALEFDVI